MNKPLVLYCKSYKTDVLRAVRLAQSVARFNMDSLPFYISVPEIDLCIFREHLDGLPVELLSDESIWERTPYSQSENYYSLPGNISQQIVKSEFWRLNLCQTYLCLDSDAQFIRPFSAKDYLDDSNIPYTVMDEGQEYRESCLRSGKTHFLDNFAIEANTVQNRFERIGKNYAFGPLPLAWHKSVWESLSKEFLIPNKISLAEAITQIPLESRWYGEALLKFKAIPLVPCQPFFKVYHYAWQFDKDQKAGINHEQLARLYSGVIYQSAWEREMDWPDEGGSALSRWARRMRRKMGKI